MSSKPFYQQCSGLLIGCLLSFIVAFLSLYLLVLQRDNQIEQVSGKVIPQLKQQAAIQQHILLSQNLISQLMTADNSSQYLNQHQLLSKQLTELSQRIRQSSLNDSLPLLQQSASLQGVLTTLSQYDSRNRQLQQQLLNQAQLALVKAKELVAIKQQRQRALLDLVDADTLSERITVNRAKGYASLVAELALLQRLAIALEQLVVNLPELTVQTTLGEFDLIRQAGQVLQQMLPELAALPQQAQSLTEFNQLITKLVQLMYEPQTMLAKWRSHLRLAADYRALLKAQQQALITLGDSYQMQVSANAQTLPEFIQQLLAIIKLNLTEQQQQLSVFALFSLSGLIFLFTLVRMRSKAKAHFEHSQSLINALAVQTDIDLLTVTSQEQNDWLNLVTKLAKPKYGEAEYLALQQQLKQEQKIIGQQQLSYFWRLTTKGEVLVHKQAYKSFALQQSQGRKLAWWNYFNKQQQRQIIQAARQAKANKLAIELELSLQNDTPINLWLEYNTKLACWQGTIANVANIDQLNQQITKVKQQTEQEQQQAMALAVANNQALLTKLTKLYLQQQWGAANSDELTDSAEPLLALIDQQGLIKQALVHRLLEFGQKAGHPNQDIALTQLLAELAFNASQLLNKDCFSQISFKLDCHQRLNAIISLAHYRYYKAMQLLLAVIIKPLARHQAEIQLTLSLLDKNAGQHAVRYRFGVRGQQLVVPAKLTALAAGDSKASTLLSLSQVDTVSALQYLLTHLHGSNFNINSDENGYCFSFELMHALAKANSEQAKEQVLNYSSEQLLTKHHQLQQTELRALISPYQAMGASVLVAHGNLSVALPWLQLLNELGFYVDYLSSGDSMQQAWQTGRYAVLLTNFEQSPFITLATNQPAEGITRAILSWQEQAWPLDEDNQDVAELWQLETLPQAINADTVKPLLTLLSPWLHDNRTNAAAPPTELESIKRVELAANKADFSQLPPAFDLASFAEHQGSAELAVFMLPHYLTELVQLQQSLATELRHKDINSCQTVLARMEQVAQIISAQPLISLLTRYQHYLTERDVQQALQQLPELQQNIEVLSLYAEAI